MIRYHYYTVRVHRYFCPVCNKRVIPCISDCVSSYFKHADESPGCEFYLGGDDYGSTDIQNLYFPNTVEVFKFIGFETFIFEELNLVTYRTLQKIQDIYYPALYCGKYLLWIKEMDELKDPNFSLNKLSESVSLFSEYFQPIFFIINKDFEPQDTTPNNIIKKIIKGSEVLFLKYLNILHYQLEKLRFGSLMKIKI